MIFQSKLIPPILLLFSIACGNPSIESRRSEALPNSSDAEKNALSLAPRDAVANCYRQHLNREPDAGGLNWYTNNIAQGKTSVQQVCQGIANSDEAKIRGCFLHHLKREPTNQDRTHYIAQANARGIQSVCNEISQSREAKVKRGEIPTPEVAWSWVKEAYQAHLGRACDQGGCNWWVDRVLYHGLKKGQLWEGLKNSEEAQVRRCFLTHLKREPSNGDRTHYINQVKARGIGPVCNEISQSREAKIHRGELPTVQVATSWVQKAYQNHLGRTCQKSECEYWVGQLWNVPISRDQLNQSIANSKEAKARNFVPPNLEWSYAGVPGVRKDCLYFNEPSDPAPWGDNFLCGLPGGSLFSIMGPIQDMDCTSVNEPSEPQQLTWHDNFICLKKNAPFKVSFHFAGQPADQDHCVRLEEPSDPHNWGDNFLCVSPK